ncbi:MAG: GNAT family N-acetyltransferase [Reichenbachiella sp.]
MKKEIDNTVELISFQSKLAPIFAQLNYEWLEEFFVVEPHDEEMLDSPYEYIIQPGGHIFFALHLNEIVGTVALINEGSGVFELAKMAVTKQHRGKGIGKKLIQKAIEHCSTIDCQLLYLMSNSKLKPAIHLYEQYGFSHTSMCETPYNRCDVRMEKTF